MSELERAANPTIEEAVKYLERMLFTQDFSPTTLRAKAVNTMAREALREQAERSKGCVWCNNTRPLERVMPHEFCLDETALLYFDPELGLEGLVISFCPMCGRKLGSGGHD